jgi:hypothetical protein
MACNTSEFPPSLRVAVAESIATNRKEYPNSISQHHAEMLRSSVDSLALGLGGVLDAIDDETAKQTFLGKALNALTFELGGETYFTAWQGTRMMHSPLTPDVIGMDFADVLDERGLPFVRAMEDAAGDGGGFIHVLLPRRLPRRTFEGCSTVGGDTVSAALPAALYSEHIHADADVFSAGIMEHTAAENKTANGFSPLSEASHTCEAVYGRHTKRTSSHCSPVEQVVYIRHIPQSAWHIAAFMPVEALSDLGGHGFSSVWPDATADKNDFPAEKNFRNGLRLSAFSLAGFAGLLMITGVSKGIMESLLVHISRLRHYFNRRTHCRP